MRPGAVVVALAFGAVLASASSIHAADPSVLSGYVDASVYPPHNEFDPNPHIPFTERAVAAYGLEVSLEVRPPFCRRLFVFANPRYYFGDRRPQNNYGWSAKPLALNLVYGGGITVLARPNLEIRVSHGEWKDAGGYANGENMPWNSVGVRWNFGSRNRP